MRKIVVYSLSLSVVALGLTGPLAACGGSGGSEFSDGNGKKDAGTLGDATTGGDGDGGNLKIMTSDSGGCAGLSCDLDTSTSCNNAGGTTITGRVLDPTGTNPI